MSNKPVCHALKTVAKSRLFEIEQMDLEFSNGECRVYERIKNRSQGAVLIVAINEYNQLILVREYCAGTDSYELGFPKGLIDKGEDCFQAANRELQEEVGFGAEKIRYIKQLSLSPGYFGARLDVVLATDLYEKKLPGDEPEPLEVVHWPLVRADELIERNDFTEARSIAALLMIKNLENNK